MGIFRFRYLSENVIRGFDSYKYSSQDTSPFSNYVLHPFWNWLVQYLPMWLAPNLLTLSGFLCLVFNALLIVYLDPSIYASSVEHLDVAAIPAWVWLASAGLNFASHTLDGLDGKQARRTKTSSPVGELFDHGLDSWSTLFFPMIAHSVFGRGRYGVDPFRLYLIYLAVMGQFVLSHWEKYVTGMFFLPWGYDLSQVGLVGLYLATWFLGVERWQGLAFGEWTYLDVVVWTVFAGFWILCVPLTLYNVAKAFASGRSRHSSLLAALAPLASPLALLAASGVWATRSPNAVLDDSPRVFYTAFGTVFSNIACRLIVSQMSNTKCQVVNRLTVAYVAVVGAILVAEPPLWLERRILFCLATGVVAAHLHYGSCVVNQMLAHFGLRAFVIPKSKN